MNLRKIKNSISPISGILLLTALIGMFFMIASYNRGIEEKVEQTAAYMTIVKDDILNHIEEKQIFLENLKENTHFVQIIDNILNDELENKEAISSLSKYVSNHYQTVTEIEAIYIHREDEFFKIGFITDENQHKPYVLENSDWNLNETGYYKTTVVLDNGQVKLLVDVPLYKNNEFDGYMISVLLNPAFLYQSFFEHYEYEIGLISKKGVHINAVKNNVIVDALISDYGLEVFGDQQNFNRKKNTYNISDFSYYNQHIVTSADVTNNMYIIVSVPYEKFSLKGIQDYLLSHLIIFGLLVLAVLGTILYSSQKTKHWVENDKQFLNEIIEMDKIQISELKKEIRFHQDFFNEASLPMMIVDKESLRIMNVNENAIAFYGYKEDDFLELYLSDVCEWSSEDKQEMEIFSINHIKRDGSTSESRVRVQEVNYGDTELIVIIVIGGQIENSEILKEVKLEMFHEIRSPLQGAYGAIEMLEKASSAHSDYTGIIKRSISNVLMMTNNVLADGKLNSNQDQVFISEFNLVDLVDEVIETTVYQDKNYNLIAGHVQINENDVIRNLDTYFIKSDPIKLRQILINLMSNGSKYTEDGLVNLIVEVKQGIKEDIVIFRISDTGLGLTSDQIEHMFESFKTYSSKSNVTSTGIGLSITKKYVEMLSSELHVSSEVGHGTNFSFSLVVPSEKEKTKEFIPQKSILVIDDDEVSCAFLKHLLTYEMNYFVKTITNETLILSELSHHEYDCLIVDQNLNHFKGVDLITLIRTSVNHRMADMPILLMTASKTKHEFRKLSGAKIDEIVLKPFKSEEIIETLNQLFSKEKIDILPVYRYINGEIIDSEVLRETIEAVGKEVFIELVTKFKTNSTEELHLITSLLADNNYESIKSLLHRLKGSMSYFAPKKCKTLIQSLELLALNQDVKFSMVLEEFLMAHEILIKELQMICRNL